MLLALKVVFLNLSYRSAEFSSNLAFPFVRHHFRRYEACICLLSVRISVHFGDFNFGKKLWSSSSPSSILGRKTAPELRRINLYKSTERNAVRLLNPYIFLVLNLKFKTTLFD